MTTKILTGLLLLSIAAAAGAAPFVLFTGQTSATSNNNATDTVTTADAGNATQLTGSIGSIQNDKEATPLWVTTGHWQLELDGPLPTQSTGAQETNVTMFNATLRMAMITNGSGLHEHKIYDFKQTNMTQTGNSTTIIHGLMTITMTDGPIENVPGFIRISNNVISVWPNAAEVNQHFGTTPIYGIVSPDTA